MNGRTSRRPVSLTLRTATLFALVAALVVSGTGGYLYSAMRQEMTLRSDLFWPLLVLNRRANADPRRTPRIKFKVPEPQAPEATGASRTVQVNLGAPAAPTPARSYNSQVIAALVAALTRKPGADDTQTGIDEAITALLSGNKPAEGLIAMLQPAIAALSGELDEQSLLGALADAFPQLDPTLLQANLGDTQTIARLIGLYAQQEGQ